MEQLLFTGSAPPHHCASWPARLSDEHGPNAHMLREPCCRLGPAAGRAGPPFFPVLGHSIARPVPQASTSSPPLRGRGRSTSPCSSRHQAQSSYERPQARPLARKAAARGVSEPVAAAHPRREGRPLVETGRRCYTVATGSTESYPLRLATPATRADQQEVNRITTGRHDQRRTKLRPPARRVRAAPRPYSRAAGWRHRAHGAA